MGQAGGHNQQFPLVGNMIAHRAGTCPVPVLAPSIGILENSTYQNRLIIWRSQVQALADPR